MKLTKKEQARIEDVTHALIGFRPGMRVILKTLGRGIPSCGISDYHNHHGILLGRCVGSEYRTRFIAVNPMYEWIVEVKDKDAAYLHKFGVYTINLRRPE